MLFYLLFRYYLWNVYLIPVSLLDNVLYYPDEYSGDTARFNCNSTFDRVKGGESCVKKINKMETCVSGGKRKISDVSDSSKIKLSENNDHRPKLKSRKHESCVALGFTANVVGTTTTKPVSCLTTLGYIWQCEAQHGRTSTYTGEVKLSASS